MADDSASNGASRRRFLKLATCALGGGVGAAVAIPAIRYAITPIGEKTVSAADDPIDALPLEQVKPGAPPLQVTLVAPVQRDGWAAVKNVPLGAAWIRRDTGGTLTALSAVCPHLGCAVGFDGKQYVCPCHDSTFALDGAVQAGPSKRGLDPLPFEVVEGRLRIAWVRYRLGGPDREKA
ncbi:MAG: ubiquinol-cytochrome c reductase iron-sulfur subunit [Deltaproteobacteria bacterium]|nr:ubiquinol-cytochrome c reductase iron-sulfur subunit [Deltaproteobacteria bacterium]